MAYMVKTFELLMKKKTLFSI